MSQEDKFCPPQFKLLKDLDVPVRSHKPKGFQPTVYYVLASDLEAALAAAPVVYKYAEPSDNNYLWFDEQDTTAIRKYSARLLCVQPIQRDTAEGLLREVLYRLQEQVVIDWHTLEGRMRKIGIQPQGGADE